MNRIPSQGPSPIVDKIQMHLSLSVQQNQWKAQLTQLKASLICLSTVSFISLIGIEKMQM